MKDWFTYNVEGGPLAAFLLLGMIVYGIGSMMVKDNDTSEELKKYRTEHQLVYIEGWVKPSVLKTIKFEEEK